MTNGSTRRNLRPVSLDSPRQKTRFHGESCINCHELCGTLDYGLQICDSCATKLAERVRTLQRRVRDVPQPLPETNRHGIPLRGGDPGQCIWPQCSQPRYKHFDAMMCYEHARHVYRAVDTYKTKQRQDIERDSAERRARWEQERAAADEAAKDQNRTQDGTIYLLRVGSYIKIGWTADLEQRMRKYPPDSVLLATQPGSRKAEHKMHRKFSHLRSHGREWYPLVPIILDQAQHMVAEHGAPADVDFGARPVEVPKPHQAKNVTYPKGWSGGRPA